MRKQSTKQNIIKLLGEGCAVEGRLLSDYTRYLYPLKYILTVNKLGWVTCNRNRFWTFENFANRMALLNDIASISKAKATDTHYFHILNRFENGDGYGIDINYKGAEQ